MSVYVESDEHVMLAGMFEHLTQLESTRSGRKQLNRSGHEASAGMKFLHPPPNWHKAKINLGDPFISAKLLH